MYFSLYLGNRVANLLSSTIPCGLSASVNSGTWTNQNSLHCVEFLIKGFICQSRLKTLRAQAFSTGPSCASWSSASPMFTLEQMHKDTLFFFFWKVMGGHCSTTSTIVYVSNKHLFENHSNNYVIINTINNLCLWSFDHHLEVFKSIGCSRFLSFFNSFTWWCKV